MALKINYAPLNHVPVGYVENAGGRDDIWDHPLHNEGVFIPPQRMLSMNKHDTLIVVTSSVLPGRVTGHRPGLYTIRLI